MRDPFGAGRGYSLTRHPRFLRAVGAQRCIHGCGVCRRCGGAVSRSSSRCLARAGQGGALCTRQQGRSWAVLAKSGAQLPQSTAVPAAELVTPNRAGNAKPLRNAQALTNAKPVSNAKPANPTVWIAVNASEPATNQMQATAHDPESYDFFCNSPLRGFNGL